jgi:tRNA1(Val) A37 N6-methylase TrmN6
MSLVVCNPPFFEEDSPTLSVMEEQEHHIECG